MRYRIRVITLMAIAVAVFLFTMWMTEPQEVSGEVNSFTAKTMNAVGDMEVAPVQPQEQENPLGEPFLIRCTCYTWTGNQCRNGSWPVEGLSVAGKEEWLGKAIIMYSVAEDGGIGEFIGYFDFTDTGLCLHPGGGCRRINKKRERVAHVLRWVVSNLANCKLPA